MLDENIIVKKHGITFFDFKKPKHLTLSTMKSFLGFSIYFVTFVIVIPYYFFKLKYYTLLEAYLPNLDLIANIVSYRGGPFGNNFFVDLYSPTITSLNSFLQTTAVNYLALLGVTYIIARETHLTKSIPTGWSIAFVMLLVTYLLPANLITELMNKVYNKTFIMNKNTTFSYVVSTTTGIIITIGIIYFEKQILLHTRNHLSQFAKRLVQIPKLL